MSSYAKWVPYQTLAAGVPQVRPSSRAVCKTAGSAVKPLATALRNKIQVNEKHFPAHPADALAGCAVAKRETAGAPGY